MQKNQSNPITLFLFAERPVAPLITVYTPQDVFYKAHQLFKGQRFVISCSINTDYKILSIRVQYGVYSDHPTVWTQPAVDGAARFNFPAAQDAHQGTYQCDYNYDFKSEVFSKPNTLYLTVKGKPKLISIAKCPIRYPVCSLF